MSGVYRIKDRFVIKGRGIVYIFIFKPNCRDILRIGDVLYDLRGNRFRIKGFEMFRYISSDPEDYGGFPVCPFMEPLDGGDAWGNYLVKTPGFSFLFCSHPFYPQRVDEDYEEEYQAAGLENPCALFSYENLMEGKLSMYGEEILGFTIYRGWMMKPEKYRILYEKLEEKGIVLINTPEEYERYHMLPGWYDDFRDVTPESVWENTGTLEAVLELTQGLTGPHIVKDYVKSRKHEWYDACFIRDIENTADCSRVVGNFINRQERDLVGGVVLRKYVELNSIGYHEKSGMPISEEYRVFVLFNTIMIIDDYWRTDVNVVFSNDEMNWIKSIAGRIRSGFATVDIARKKNGELIVMELGDGQVSGLQQIVADRFYKEMKRLTFGSKLYDA